jgi:Mechanosensitive ion channel, conserved TM helix
MGHFIVNTLSEAWDRFSDMAMRFLPRLIAMAIIIALGWVIAWLLKVVVRRVLALLKFNNLFEATGFTQLLAKTALPSPAELLSRLVFWVVWVSFLLFGLSALQIVALQEEISRFFEFLPQIFVALLIFFVGLLAANFFARAALLASVNANYPSPRLISGVVKFVIIILSVTMALERLELGHGVVLVAFTIAFGSMMLALALAFGLGGRDAARRMLEKRFSEDRKEQEEEEISHL